MKLSAVILAGNILLTASWAQAPVSVSRVATLKAFNPENIRQEFRTDVLFMSDGSIRWEDAPEDNWKKVGDAVKWHRQN